MEQLIEAASAHAKASRGAADDYGTRAAEEEAQRWERSAAAAWAELALLSSRSVTLGLLSPSASWPASEIRTFRALTVLLPARTLLWRQPHQPAVDQPGDHVDAKAVCGGWSSGCVAVAARGREHGKSEALFGSQARRRHRPELASFTHGGAPACRRTWPVKYLNQINQDRR